MQHTWIISKTDLPKSMEKLSSTKWSLVPKRLETAALRDGTDIYFFIHSSVAGHLGCSLIDYSERCGQIHGL